MLLYCWAGKPFEAIQHSGQNEATFEPFEPHVKHTNIAT